MIASLYVHLPFCARKCAYCDFESYAGRLAETDAYIDRLLSEARAAKQVYGAFGVPTVYFGGGTPSLLEARQLKRLADGLFDIFPPDLSAEITMEANPGTVSLEKLAAAREAGINRLSLGVQSSCDATLKRIGRIHTFAQAAHALELARNAGFENISCDLMYGLPQQSTHEVLESVSDILALKPKHISCYSLIPEEGTPLGDSVLNGKISVPNDEEVCRQQDAVIDALAAQGFERYEISNYAQKGFESRHNCVYWTGGNYLGLGCSAHSFMNSTRFSNPRFDDYMGGAQWLEAETVDTQGRLEETLLLATRMTRGIEMGELERCYGTATVQSITDAVSKLAGLAEINDGRLLITKQGYNLHNEVVFRLIQAVQTED